MKRKEFIIKRKTSKIGEWDYLKLDGSEYEWVEEINEASKFNKIESLRIWDELDSSCRSIGMSFQYKIQELY